MGADAQGGRGERGCRHPAGRLSVPVPSVVDPSRNVTVPVGMPAPGGVAMTVAVRFTDWPNTEGLAEAVTVVVSSGVAMNPCGLPDES